MYVPAHFALEETEVWQVVRSVASGFLVVATAQGPRSVFAPVVVDQASRTLRGHVARGNSWWSAARDGDRVLALIRSADGYVLPSLYPSKSRDPAVVPTWNYVVCELSGTVRLHDDAEWVDAVVRDLTETFESRRRDPWSVDDAPAN